MFIKDKIKVSLKKFSHTQCSGCVINCVRRCGGTISCTAVTRLLHRAAFTAASFAAGIREPCCGGHTARTAALVKAISEEAQKLGFYKDTLDARYIRTLELAAPLHDIGKLAVPRAILGKPGKLTPDEFNIIKTHAAAGRAIIGNFMAKTGDCGYLSTAAEIAGGHHERWDGGGYPAGLVGENIPLCARIMAVADVFDALCSRRPYKPAYPFEQSLEIILRESGRQFDPRLCEALASASERLRLIMNK